MISLSFWVSYPFTDALVHVLLYLSKITKTSPFLFIWTAFGLDFIELTVRFTEIWISLEMGERTPNTPLQTSRPNVRIGWSPCTDVYFCCCRLLFRSEDYGSQSCCSHSIRTDGSVTYFLQFFPPGTNTMCSRQRTTLHGKKDRWKDLWENRGKVIFPFYFFLSLSLTVSQILRNLLCFVFLIDF